MFAFGTKSRRYFRSSGHMQLEAKCCKGPYAWHDEMMLTFQFWLNTLFRDQKPLFGKFIVFGSVAGPRFLFVIGSQIINKTVGVVNVSLLFISLPWLVNVIDIHLIRDGFETHTASDSQKLSPASPGNSKWIWDSKKDFPGGRGRHSCGVTQGAD